MTKLSLTSLANLQNEQTAVSTINANSAAIATALENTLSRDGTPLNQMNSALDMNSYPILNLPAPSSANEPIRFADAATLGTTGIITVSNAITISGQKFGLTLSNNASDLTNSIDIAVGSAASDALNPVLMSLPSIYTKRLNATWAVGTNQGGLDTGSIANTSYHIWLIKRVDTNVVDVLFSTSPTSPIMPTNYTQKRRIGSIVRTAGAILPFSQTGNLFYLATPFATNGLTLATASRTGINVLVPNSVVYGAICTIGFAYNGVSAYGVLTNFSEPDLPASATNFSHLVNVTSQYSAQSGIYLTNSSAQIFGRTSQISATLDLVNRGWVDYF